jgi:hypothetical protein
VTGSFNNSGDSDYYYFTMPAENVTVSAEFVTAITVSGTLTIKTKGLDALNGAALYLYSDTSYNNQVAYINLSPGSGSAADDVTTYSADWSVKLAPSTSKPYYAELGYWTSGGNNQYKELGKLFDAGSVDVTSINKTVEIGAVAMHGTLSVTINGTPVTFFGSGNDRLAAYGNATYTDYIGYTTISSGGAWTMSIPDTYPTVYFAFETSDRDTYAFYKLGGKTVTAATETALSGTFTTKTITGTVKDGETPIMAQLVLLSGTAASLDALYTKFQNGQIEEYAYTNTSDGGAWTATVLSDVASAYILVISPGDEDSIDYYITKSKITLTQGTPINLDIGNTGTMTFLGTETYN